MQVGDRIKELRTILGMSGRQLAGKADIAPSFLSDIERNKSNPTIETIQRICTALGVPLSDFFSKDKPELDPNLRRIVDAAKKLNSRQQELILGIMEEWARLNYTASIKEYRQDLTLLDKLAEKKNDIDYLCQLINSGIIVLTDKGRPLTPEQKDGFIKYLKEKAHPELLNSDINLKQSPLAAHMEGEPGLKPELEILLNQSLKLNQLLEKYLNNVENQNQPGTKISRLPRKR
ncbi:helix-turn-helix domain-containing protein [Desulfoscipio geothermicus]|uniref:Transcriptional regulator, contains XRE-family HTH domain n=1 Tax=Desulfoscipio geothermicus DSM 3669 TaxID=1121426 RepID=A0A1I6E3S3_9FIRM|nr:helix-turn-helix transcriptional regulator [Desulfoscipio geothermicus]SFR12409.1 Transcriptional regulator, contains XRE-family HTH domain [Desulfoscipio geothermicus DSM 3669]